MNCLGIFSENTQISKFVKILAMEAVLLHADEKTDLELIDAFLSFCEHA
jgi:hypothetical protein